MTWFFRWLAGAILISEYFCYIIISGGNLDSSVSMHSCNFNDIIITEYHDAARENIQKIVLWCQQNGI